jgi:EpsI family protein
MNKSVKSALMMVTCMAIAGGIANSMKPTHKIADERSQVKFEDVIPAAFGHWRNLPSTNAVVANPQANTLLNTLYSQLVNRTYTDDHGHTIMLSIAYGEDQRDGMQLHYPEICYPVQGFQVTSNTISTLTTTFGVIPIRRLETKFHDQRYEPVTYWTTVGDRATLGGMEKKLLEMRYGLHGLIPDGLLFRVSSIDRDSTAAFAAQAEFARDLLTELSPELRTRLAGLQK